MRGCEIKEMRWRDALLQELAHGAGESRSRKFKIGVLRYDDIFIGESFGHRSTTLTDYCLILPPAKDCGRRSVTRGR